MKYKISFTAKIFNKDFKKLLDIFENYTIINKNSKEEAMKEFRNSFVKKLKRSSNISFSNIEIEKL